MDDRHQRAVAIVGVAAILPDAPSARAFRDNVWSGRYSVSEVPEGRWSVADYYDPDPAAPDKTYSRIGGWVRGFAFDWKRFHVPPRVAAAMDEGQQWAVTVAADALCDYGHPARPLDLDRTAVVLGAAMGGELHYLTNLRICFPEYARALAGVREFEALPQEVRRGILDRWQEAVAASLPHVTEDSMPGELPNILSGRVANLLNLHGTNFVTDAACASTLAALETARDLLVEHECDAAITGGIDRNMGVSSFVKFCKIGALSATGSRPFGAGADGFVMGEGAAAYLLKRLADAERDGDRIYAVVRGVAGASDGRGKGITAPNPLGQQTAMRRAWDDAGLDPATCGLLEAHGTSTRVGDVVEVESLRAVFAGAPRGAIALGSAKSNVGHLKAAAGAAGLLKAMWALHDRALPPTLHAQPPNPEIDFGQGPFVLNHELRDWPRANGTPRRAGVSAYGFGGTNFHAVLEEHVPGALGGGERKQAVAVPAAMPAPAPTQAPRGAGKPPLRGVAALGAATAAELKAEAGRLLARVKDGALPAVSSPPASALAAAERLVIDFGDGRELAERLGRASRALETDEPASWRALQAQGIFRGHGPAPGRIAFLFPGQGSQWVNMGRELARDGVVAGVLAEADSVTAALLGRPLTGYIFADADDPQAMAGAEKALTQTSITQPAVLTVDMAVHRLLLEYGIEPDIVMGHSLGEYAALSAAGVLPFADALDAAAARGREMTRVSVEDNGWMAAVPAPLAVVEELLAGVDGYVVAANVNSRSQCVIGGASEAVRRAMAVCEQRGLSAVRLPVSHAFHTRIVAPASGPLREVLDRLRFAPPRMPIVSNVTGGFYPSSIDAIKDLLQRQIASPVQWVAGLETLYAAGVRTFVEVGPKKALKGFVDDVFAGRADVVSLFTNHPRPGEVQTFNHALCGLYAAGYGGFPVPNTITTVEAAGAPAPASEPAATLEAMARLLAEGLQQLRAPARPRFQRNAPPEGSVVISGTGLGLPGAEKPVMDPGNAGRVLHGEQFVDLVPQRFRGLMVDKRITRLVKGEDGSGRFETIDDAADVIKLAGRPGAFDLAAEYGVPEALVEASDVTTQLALAAGIDALREAGLPLVLTWRRTRSGRDLPDRWVLPEPLRDETGVLFASAFPGYDRFADEMGRYYEHEARRHELALLDDLRRYTGDEASLREIARRRAEIEDACRRQPYAFDRRFLLRTLAMGHSQFAEYIGARGPNAQLNVACASTTSALALAEDWIRGGRCRRVIVVGADDVTSDRLLPWMGPGFLAAGAAATDDRVEEAALPFDRRRHGMLLGMGACALVVESQDALEERGMRGIVELLSSETRNSAHHATRLDVRHIAEVMESLVAAAEARYGLDRRAMAPATAFLSHETFTPARGGSASAEVEALRRTFGDAASEIVVANTKGFTGHPMGVGVEDVIGVKVLEHGIVPPVPNYKEVDPELGRLNLSRGGRYPVTYAIRLAAGFGSQIALTLTRRIPGGADRVDSRATYQRWLSDVTGLDGVELEVVKRTLRVKAARVPARPAVAATWTFGTGPVRRAAAPGDGTVFAAAPLAAPAAAAVSAAEPILAGDPPPPPAAEPAAVVPVPEAAAPAADDASPAASVKQKVLAIVAEKTGYPADMLDMELDLEADLGVDTVKQAETFAAVREAYGIPRQETLRLRDFPTLRHVVKFVLDHRPDLAGAAAEPADAGTPVPDAPPPTAAARPTPLPIEDADRIPRRVPVPAVRVALDACKPTGVRLAQASRVIVAADQGGVAPELAHDLGGRGVEVLTLDPRDEAEAVRQRVAAFAAAGDVEGVFWLPALDPEPPLDEIDLAAFRGLIHARVKNLYETMRALGERAFLVAGTRLGGWLGLGEAAAAPLGGAVAGFAKACRRERSRAHVKAVDFAPTEAPAAIARLLVEEALADPGVVEVGYRDGLRWAPVLQERAAEGVMPALGPDAVFVVTGAAGGITSAIVADLAAASGGTFHLLDIAAAPAAGDPEVALLRRNPDALKAALIEEARARGERPTPAAIDRRLLAAERAEAALRAVEAVQAAGGRAVYHSLDLCEEAAVRAVMDEVRAAHGRVDVLVHAAGTEVSHRLEDKPRAEFDRVFDVKAEGLFNLLTATRGLPLGALVVFGSVAGRFGNAGQADYSAANALLAALASHVGALRPETRALAIDWTAWDRIGMAARGSIPAVMAAAGVETLPPEVGVPTLRRELAAGSRGEVLVAGRLGAMAAELDETGGLDAAAMNARLAASGHPLLQAAVPVRVSPQDGLVLEATLDPSRQPFLFDHQIEGTPVLPGVMGTEAFAEIAAALCPGWQVAAVEDEEFLLAFKFHRGKPATLRLSAQATGDRGGDIVVATALRSTVQPRPELPSQEKLHFRGRVRLARQLPAAPRAEFPPDARGEQIERDAIYRVFFHGPAYRVLDSVTVDQERAVGVMAGRLPDDVVPPGCLLTTPRLLELCFQTAGTWLLARRHLMALPAAIGRVRFFAAPDSGTQLYAVVEARAGGGAFDGRVLDAAGQVYLELSDYRVVPLPEPRTLVA